MSDAYAKAKPGKLLLKGGVPLIAKKERKKKTKRVDKEAAVEARTCARTHRRQRSRRD